MELKLVKTHVIRCASCNKWLFRLPQWCEDDFGKDHQCKCGCTSISITEGRPFGPRSKYWSLLTAEFEDMLQWWGTGDDLTWLLSTVVVEGGPLI